MERFTGSIRQAIESGNWFSAIFLGLAMPDICGGLETPNEKPGIRYRRWFNENLKRIYVFDNQFDMLSITCPDLIERLTSNAFFENVIQDFKLAPVVEGTNFTASDCYAFRNACLHSGMSKDDKKRFALTPPPAAGQIIHRNNINGTLYLQIDILCEDICKAVDMWAERVSGDEVIMARISELIEVKFE
jgi:hypothetical protein